jgi:hypothetical protein
VTDLSSISGLLRGSKVVGACSSQLQNGRPVMLQAFWPSRLHFLDVAQVRPSIGYEQVVDSAVRLRSNNHDHRADSRRSSAGRLSDLGLAGQTPIGCRGGEGWDSNPRWDKPHNHQGT